MSTRILKLFFGIVLVNFCGILLYGESGPIGPNSQYILLSTATDTIPLKERYGDHVTDETRNPFDIQTSIIDENVEYDAESGKYIITEKIGEEYYRMPTYMDFEEYLDWRAKEQEKDYFNRLAGVGSSRRSSNGLVDPMTKVDIKQNMVDRLFGGNGVTIEPNGSIDMTFGVDYQNVQNPFIAPRLQRQGGFDFDMDIQMALNGKIGDKMDIGFNYDTQATFDFDNKIKLAYDSEKFSEDDIIKTIEAGDVNLPLRSQLIQGNESLFGLKTELQFGKMRVTAIASQQRSEQKDLVIENGALVQEFEVRPDEYDENRHFFLSHYARDSYEGALTNMPQIKSLYRITNLEVWVTNDQNSDLRNSATVAAISDLGESDLARFGDPQTMFPPRSPLPADLVDINGNPLPDNTTSNLFLELVNDSETRQIVNTTTKLKTVYGMKQTRDFEVQSMRKLNPNEFTFHQNLGFISINVRLRPNQVLGVAYEYTYSLNGDKIYKVGELTNESNRGGLNEENDPEPEDVIYVKMLKSTNQRTDLPSWDLMMKNVYPLGTAQLNQEDFQLDIFYEDFSDATLKRFLPETTADKDFRTIPLLEVFELDKLNRQGDPQQDGVFDFIPNLTVNTRTGSVFFPVLEPFGSSLLKLLDGNSELYKKYGYPALYNNTITEARENLDANRFVIKGKYKSSISSEISLGGFNIPQGSVVVRAGSQILREGVDYDIDYGIGRIKIINDAYLQQGVPIRVSFEDQSLFSLQQKTMLGMRFDYEASKKLNLGATYMRLFERPYTEKVNLGDDPINNRIFGFDMTYSSDAPLITRIVDKFPFYSTKEPSAINFTAEVAALKPGHSKAINVGDAGGGVVSIDDFEGAGSSIPLGSRPNLWVLASTPETDDRKFQEAELVNDRNYGVNRAALNWYVIDNRNARTSEDRRNSYSRAINQNELFDRDLPAGVIPDLLTFDLTYKPDERGPYNFDLPEGTQFSAGLEVEPTSQNIKLKDPESRWGGIMRYLPNNDFQASNFQYIEFWLLNPFMDDENVTHDPNEEGMLYFNLGNVSEDVLKDNLQFYENSLPTPEENIPIQGTEWGQVPLSIPQVNGFDQQNINIQDLGFDGLNDNSEREVYRDYVDNVLSAFPASNNSISMDPANDNFLSYLDERFAEDEGIIERYSKYNNPEGNAPDANSRIGTGNPIPDAEDLNDNRSLESSESYYEYKIPMENEGGEIKRFSGDYITDVRDVNVQNGGREKWYRYRVPIQRGRAVNDIQGFRSIQFIRMYMDGFKSQKTFRLAEFELVRNQWRQLPIDSTCFADGSPNSIEFVVDEIGLEENSNKEPFRYVMPVGIKRERLFNTFSNVQQDEKSLKMNVCGLPDSCDAMIYKLTEPDLRLFEKMQMFVHAESSDENLEDGDMAIFIRLGKDFNNNFYEYEIPLKLTDPDVANTAPESTMEYAEQVWQRDNYVNVALEAFTELKKARNLSGFALTDEYVKNVGEFQEILRKDTTLNRNANLKIKGNPSLGYIKGIVIGIRNKKGGVGSLCGEVWVNELRMAGIKEDGGVAGLARLEVQLADLGDITASARYSSVGWGALDQRVAERSLDRNIEYDVATNLELAKFTPKNWNLTVPFYAQYSKQQVKPKYDPYELDLTVNEVLESTTDPDEIIDIKDRSTQETKIKTFAFSNVRKNRASGSKGSPKPWDISNVSASYSYTQTTYKDEIIKYDRSDDYRGGLDYDYSKRPNYIQPFKKSKVKLLKEFNFNPLPNSYSFSTQLRRFKSEKLYRIPDPKEIEYLFNDKRFDWDRRYNMQWDFTKALNLTFSANNYGVVDELRQVGVRKTAADRNWVDERGDIQDRSIVTDAYRKDYIRNNIRDFGRNKNYDHRVVVNYTLPIRYLPYMDWINMKAQYSADYAWTRASINADSLGNVIQNNQARSFNATFNFDKLYNKSKYLKSLDQRAPRRRSSRNEKKDDDKSKDTAAKKRTKRGGNKARVASGAEKFFVRPLLSLRSIKFTYKENLGTVVPGFLPSTTYLGMASGFNTPGWGFVAGLQPDISKNNPDNFLVNASRNNWISTSIYQNQQVIQNNTQNYEARVELEPWRDFKINVNFKKQFIENHSEDFININGNPNDPLFRQLALRDVGSFEVTYFAMNTLFNEDIRSLFRNLSDSRTIISKRLADPSLTFPDVITHETDGFSYAKGLGRQHNDILVPAFIAAYTGQDPNTIELDLQKQVGNRAYIPKPNWDLKYNGLSKIPMFSDIFSNVNITHGYKSTLRVSRYSSDLQYKEEDPFNIDPLINTKNYFARLEIPEIIISEQFSPIIGIDVKTKSNMNMNFEWKKTRNLLLSIGLGQLTEARATEYVFGFGFTKENVNIGFLTGGNSGGRRGSRGSRTGDDLPEEPSSNRGGVSNSRGRELSFNLDFALRDDVTWIHKFDDGASEKPLRGLKSIRFNPSVDYDLNENLTLRMFFDYSNSKPYLSTSYPITSIQGGITASFILN